MWTNEAKKKRLSSITIHELMISFYDKAYHRFDSSFKASQFIESCQLSVNIVLNKMKSFTIGFLILSLSATVSFEYSMKIFFKDPFINDAHHLGGRSGFSKSLCVTSFMNGYLM